MDLVIRAVVLFLFLLLIMRVSGRRTLGEMTPFDFIIVLIVSEASQQALVGEDYSITGGLLVISTLVGLDVGLSLLKQRSKKVARWLDGSPTVLIRNGRLENRALHESRVDVDEILAAAREQQGIGRLEEIEYAVLETSGAISILPYDSGSRKKQKAEQSPAPT